MFKNRIEAGRYLANSVPDSFITNNSLVIGIGLKGIPVSCSFAKEKKLPIDFVIAKKVPMIGKPFIAIGAVTSDGTCVLDELMLRKAGLKEEQLKNYINSIIEDLRNELIKLRGSYLPPDIRGKQIIIVDDGISTGQTMLAVIKCVKKQGADKVSVIVPASSFLGFKKIESEIDNFYALRICNDPNFAVDSLYEEERMDREKAKECINTVKMLGLTAYSLESVD
ncbi:MAG: phosphoribosyltransferase family protein [Actinobacteria bacterium]|nr:phosphoribosyltransferase family protein [Actinomycetota bacterium]